MALSALLLLAVEGVLRLCGYGGYPPTFREIGPGDGGVLISTFQGGAASYFFANRTRPGSIDDTTFLQPKPAGTVRIMLFGGSAMKGFPQSRAFAASAFLAEMLGDLWPDRTVEVINAGTTAVASFPVLGMLTEGIAYDPDLVVVYCGNNEFFGAYGVCSLHAAGNSPAAMRFQRWLRSLGLAQSIGALLPARGDGARKTLMEMMIGHAFTAADDPRRAAAARNLEANIGEMIDRCRAKGVPIIVCTPPSNERDLAPLGTDDLSHLPAGDQQKVATLLRSGRRKLTTDPAGAAADLEEVLARHPHHALAHFLLGRAFLALNADDRAQMEFRKALDDDPMPWRAPGPSVEAVRRAAAAHGAVLCDLVGAFRRASPHGAIGWELMDDHVHPSLKGQARVARSIAESLTAFEAPLAVDRAAFEALPAWEDYARRLGDNPYDRFAVAYTLSILCDIPFYRETNPAAFERFHGMAERLRRTLPPEIVEVVRRWEGPTMHRGAKRPLSGEVARKRIAAGDFAGAQALLDVARRSVPSRSSWNIEYTYLMLACRLRANQGLSEEDLAVARRAIARGRSLLRYGRSTDGNTERNIGRLHQLCEEYAEAIPYLVAARRKIPPGDQLVAADRALVDSYVRTGRLDEALTVVEQGLASSGRYVPIYRELLARLRRERATHDRAQEGARRLPP